MDHRFNSALYDDEYYDAGSPSWHRASYRAGRRTGFAWGLVCAVPMALVLWSPVIYYAWPLIRGLF